jgi:hypothetical protein
MTENEKWKCPICGAENSGVETVTQTLTMPYVPKKDVEIFVWTCTSCKQSGDFLNRNDDIIEAALSSMEDVFVKDTIDFLKTRGYSMPSLDRILSLPQGTINSYYFGDFDKEVVALFRILKTFPWMLSVADGNFSPAVSAPLLLKAASDVLGKYVAKLPEEQKK